MSEHPPVTEEMELADLIRGLETMADDAPDPLARGMALVALGAIAKVRGLEAAQAVAPPNALSVLPADEEAGWCEMWDAKDGLVDRIEADRALRKVFADADAFGKPIKGSVAQMAIRRVLEVLREMGASSPAAPATPVQVDEQDWARRLSAVELANAVQMWCEGTFRDGVAFTEVTKMFRTKIAAPATEEPRPDEDEPPWAFIDKKKSSSPSGASGTEEVWQEMPEGTDAEMIAKLRATLRRSIAIGKEQVETAEACREQIKKEHLKISELRADNRRLERELDAARLLLSAPAGEEPVTILTDSGEAYRINAAVREALTMFGAKYVCSGDMPDFLADLDREFPALSAPLAQPTPSATDEET